jgi:hypothetical protein
MLAARLATCKLGADRVSDQSANLHSATRSDAAEKFNVSQRSVSSAKKVLASGDEKLIADVQAGNIEFLGSIGHGSTLQICRVITFYGGTLSAIC